jgi:hypothetical protein
MPQAAIVPKLYRMRRQNTYKASYTPMMMLEKERLMSEPTPPAIMRPPTALFRQPAARDE